MKAQVAAVTACAVGAFLLSRRPMKYVLKNRVVVISGGSRGLGLALAREFAGHQARLALLARDVDELERAVRDLESRGANVTRWVCDVKDESDVARTISAIGKEYGRIDVLVNNAGIMLVAPLDAMEKEDFEQALSVHFWGTYHLTMAALPLLKRAAESRIVNIASIGGRVAVPHMAPYCASKFALTGFSDAIRSELARQGVRVTTVCPGLMRTGSHINAEFKGHHAGEFAWFSLSAGMPFLSIGASRAARQIVAATRRGQPELVITLQARALILAQAVAPNLLARILQIANSLLPKYANGAGRLRRKGHESQSRISPSRLTYLADEASRHFNETPRQP